MKFIVITPSETPPNEHAIISHMLKNGLPSLHVRKPAFSQQQMVDYIDQFTDEEQSKMVLHSYHQIMLDYDLKGLHLSKRHRKLPFKSWLNKTLIELRMGKKISMSTSSKSLSSMADNYKEFEYVMLTPVFTDPKGHRASFSAPLLQQVLRSFPDKIVARGGSNAESIEKARDMGFAGIAFHNFFWDHENPIAEYDKVLDKFNQLGLRIS
jgi:thiamine-phosphate pyrophosphorylase